jgi:tRNA/tmRNA/rRNA uracil-C5-methylase (TrmA/RlmC/RlmD family)
MANKAYKALYEEELKRAEHLEGELKAWEDGLRIAESIQRQWVDKTSLAGGFVALKTEVSEDFTALYEVRLTMGEVENMWVRDGLKHCITDLQDDLEQCERQNNAIGPRYEDRREDIAFLHVEIARLTLMIHDIEEAAGIGESHIDFSLPPQSHTQNQNQNGSTE